MRKAVLRTSATAINLFRELEIIIVKKMVGNVDIERLDQLGGAKVAYYKRRFSPSEIDGRARVR